MGRLRITKWGAGVFGYIRVVVGVASGQFGAFGQIGVRVVGGEIGVRVGGGGIGDLVGGGKARVTCGRGRMLGRTGFFGLRWNWWSGLQGLWIGAWWGGLHGLWTASRLRWRSCRGHCLAVWRTTEKIMPDRGSGPREEADKNGPGLRGADRAWQRISSIGSSAGGRTRVSLLRKPLAAPRLRSVHLSPACCSG